MRKINKIMLLSITAFVPFATVVACSSQINEPKIQNDIKEPKNQKNFEEIEFISPSAPRITRKNTTIRMKFSKIPKDAKAEDFVLSI